VLLDECPPLTDWDACESDDGCVSSCDKHACRALAAGVGATTRTACLAQLINRIVASGAVTCASLFAVVAYVRAQQNSRVFVRVAHALDLAQRAGSTPGD